MANPTRLNQAKSAKAQIDEKSFARLLVPPINFFPSFEGAFPPWKNLIPKARRLPRAKHWRRPAA